MKMNIVKLISQWKLKLMKKNKKKNTSFETSIPSTSIAPTLNGLHAEYVDLNHIPNQKVKRSLSATVQFINQKLEEVYHQLRPSRKVVEGQLFLYSVIQKQITDLFENVDVYVFGSTINGFGYSESDMDLTVVGFYDKQMRRTKQGLLDDIMYYLMEEECVKQNGLIDAVLLSRTNFPIIKLQAELDGHVYDLDLGIGSRQGICNSILLNCYARIDKRVRLLDMIVKEWIKLNELFGGNKQRFNSYTLSLMVIYFLQRGIQPPILPNLHQEKVDIFNVNFNCDPFEVIREFELNFDPSKQEMSLIELFFAFVDFYDSFDFESQVIAIHKVDDSSGYGSDEECFSFMNIEDPCGGYNPSRGLCRECFENFKMALSRVRTSKWFNIMSSPAYFDPQTYDLDLNVLLSYFGVDVNNISSVCEVQSDSLYCSMYPPEPYNFSCS